LLRDDRYSPLYADVWQSMQERQRHIIAFLKSYASKPLSELSVIEIGCGGGANLLELLRLGFAPGNLCGNELIPERAVLARRNLPAALRIVEGDAMAAEFSPGAFDIVYQSTVFSSILDDEFQERLATRMWNWVKPGGCVLWYDFIYDNPGNRDVRGVTVSRVRQLFPEGCVHRARVTLAPPISRRVSRIHPSLYRVFNVLPFLRTHVLCWISKADSKP
jgi:SAM-dependent methyltransferase